MQIYELLMYGSIAVLVRNLRLTHRTQNGGDSPFRLGEPNEADAHSDPPFVDPCCVLDLPFEPDSDRVTDRGNFHADAATNQLGRRWVLERDSDTEHRNVDDPQSRHAAADSLSMWHNPAQSVGCRGTRRRYCMTTLPLLGRLPAPGAIPLRDETLSKEGCLHLSPSRAMAPIPRSGAKLFCCCLFGPGPPLGPWVSEAPTTSDQRDAGPLGRSGATVPAYRDGRDKTSGTTHTGR